MRVRRSVCVCVCGREEEQEEKERKRRREKEGGKRQLIKEEQHTAQHTEICRYLPLITLSSMSSFHYYQLHSAKIKSSMKFSIFTEYLKVN